MNQKINTTVLTSIKLETYNIWIHIRGEELKSMILEGKKIGFALTGSFCTFKKTIPQIAKLIEEGAEVLPIMSFNSYNINSRFGEANEFIKKIEEITNKKIINKIEEAEIIGAKHLTDIMVIAPCSRKHNWKTIKWNCRYTSTYGSKIKLKK